MTWTPTLTARRLASTAAVCAGAAIASCSAPHRAGAGSRNLLVPPSCDLLEWSRTVELSVSQSDDGDMIVEFTKVPGSTDVDYPPGLSGEVVIADELGNVLYVVAVSHGGNSYPYVPWQVHRFRLPPPRDGGCSAIRFWQWPASGGLNPDVFIPEEPTLDLCAEAIYLTERLICPE